MQIRRCHHIKVNGTQCGSPALRGKCYCYFHHQYRDLGAYGVPQRGRHNLVAGRFPALEDANSIQAAVMQVIRLILAKQIDSKEAGLLLYALQIASTNLQHLQLDPLPANIVVDPLLVAHSPLGGKPAREEQFKAETEDEQKQQENREQQLETAQQQADAEWQAEICREFEPSPNAETEVAEEDPSSRQRFHTPTREQVMKLYDAGAALTQHPGEPEYVRAYEAAWAEAEEPIKEPSET